MKKRWIYCGLIICMSVLAAGCSKKRKTFSEGALVEESYHPIVTEGVDYRQVDGIEMEPELEIVMIATDSENEYYDMVKAGAEQAVEDFNAAMGYDKEEKLSLVFEAPKGDDVIEQINIIDQFLDKAPDALCIAFSDASACKTQMDMAKDNGIKLIAFDTPDEHHATETVVSTDNVAAATLAADKLFANSKQGDKIAVIVHSSMKQTGQERYRSITNLYNKKYVHKELHFVEIVYMAQDERSGEMIFDELLEKHPDLAGIICTDLITTESAIDYVSDLEGKNIQIVGFDMNETIAEAIEDGTILGSVAQDPYGMGYATVVAAVRSISGMHNAENIYTDYLWVDKDNLENDEVKVLYADR